MEEHYDEHYKSEHQPIEVMQANMTNDELIGFLRGNIIKYALRFGSKNGTKKEAAKKCGLLLAEKAIKAKITNVVFDRNGYIYTGRVSSFADGAREGGLKF